MVDVDLGSAELTPDPYRPGATLLSLDGVAQSYVDIVEPERLEFSYMRLMAAVLDSAVPVARPVRILHLGGGGCSMPRYLVATRATAGLPLAEQVVVERDGALAALVERALPLPLDAGIELRIGDAREAVDSAEDSSYDVVVCDVYEGARMVGTVSTLEFVATVADVLAPGGTYVVNVTDLPPLAFSKRQVATVRAAFPDVCTLAEPGTGRGKRYGNLIIAARRPPGPLPVDRMRRRAVRSVPGAEVLHGVDLDGFTAGARPLTDGEVR